MVAGRNAELKTRLDQIEPPPRHLARVLGFTTEMDELMAAADLVVSKPGGLTTSEALARGTPMAIVNPIPGQESRNSDFLLENGAAIKINNVATLPYKLGQLLATPGRLAALAANAKRLGRPRAAFDVAPRGAEVAVALVAPFIALGNSPRRASLRSAGGTLRAIEGRGGRDFGNDRPGVLAAAIVMLLRGYGRRLLFGRVEKDGRTVLASDVRPLAVPLRRIVAVPKSLQQLLVRNDCRVELHQHGLGMSRGVGANVFVGGILDRAAAVAHRGRGHAGNLPKGRLHTPKTTGGERSRFHHGRAGPR